MNAAQESKKFSKEEFARNNGKNGTPAFFAVNGKVYDVTVIVKFLNNCKLYFRK